MSGFVVSRGHACAGDLDMPLLVPRGDYSISVWGVLIGSWVVLVRVRCAGDLDMPLLVPRGGYSISVWVASR